MTSIDGLLAILEDRGLMPAVALFSLTAVLGLLYLSSGNPPGAKPPPPTKPRHRIRRIDVPRHGMPCGRDGDAVTMGNESDERNGNEGLR